MPVLLLDYHGPSNPTVQKVHYFSDMDQDGLMDIGQYQKSVYSGGYSDGSLGLLGEGVFGTNLLYSSQYFNDTFPVAVADFNGDQWQDVMHSYRECYGCSTEDYYEARTDLYLGRSVKSDILEKIEYESGAAINIYYSYSAQEKDQSGNLLNPDLPFNVHVVKEVVVNDGLENLNGYQYKYSEGDNISFPDINIKDVYGFAKVDKKIGQAAPDVDLGNGWDGDFVSTGDAIWTTDKNFISLHIQSGHTITVNPDIRIKVQGDAIIDGILNAKGQGYIGGEATGNGGLSGEGPGGGGGATVESSFITGGGGGAGHLAAGMPGAGNGGGDGGSSYGFSNLEPIFMGSGGGGAFSPVSGGLPGGPGGNGGGIIQLFAKNITINGEINADGLDGGDGVNGGPNGWYYSGGGGAGSGGSIYIKAAETVDIGTNLVHALGGQGGVGGHASNPGGDASDGRIRVEAKTISGSSNPVYYTAGEHSYSINTVYYNPDLQKTTNYYHTAADDGLYLHGRQEKSEKYDNTDNLFLKQFNNWQAYNLNNDRKFVYNATSTKANFTESIESTGLEYFYDFINGNILTESNLGEVSLNTDTGAVLDIISGDEKNTYYDYAENTSDYILAAPMTKIISNTGDTKQQDLYYDNLSLGDVEKVNLTKEDFIEDDVEIRRDFNNFGLVTAEYDPRGATTTITYDTAFMYPTSTINALNHLTLTEYNLFNNQIASSTNSNGVVTNNTFDAFGRLTKTEITDPDNQGGLIIKQEIIYNDAALPRYVEIKDYFTNTNYRTSREYYNGLNKLVQKKSQTGVTTEWSTVDIIYDSQGRVKLQTLPYITDTINYSALEITEELDPQELATIDSTIALWHMNGELMSDPKRNATNEDENYKLDEINVTSTEGFDDLTDGTYHFATSSSSRLEVDDFSNNPLDFQNTDFTIESWVKFDNQPPQDNVMTIVSKSDDNNQIQYLLTYRDDTHGLRGLTGIWAVISLDGTRNSNEVAYDAYWPFVPTPGVWYYIVMTYDQSAGAVEVFINGESKGIQNGFPTSIYNGSQPFRVGAIGGGAYWGGSIDEIRVSNEIIASEDIYNNYFNFVTITNEPYKIYTYDTLDRILTESTPVGVTSYEYDGFTTTITDANGNQKDLIKDAYGNLVQVKEYNNGEIYTTDYEYTLTSKLEKITDSEGHVRNFVYDELDNLVSQDMVHHADNPTPATMTYTHDKNGNIVTQTDFASKTISYTYDSLNRPLTEKTGFTTKIAYTYDQGAYGQGQLTFANYQENNTKAYAYDILGRVVTATTTIQGTPYVLRYEYNLDNNLTKVIYPNNFTVDYTYNDIGQIDSVALNSDILANNIEYNANGQMIYVARDNGVTTTYTYDPEQNYRLVNLASVKDTDTLQDIDYIYDSVGNITEITDNSDTVLAKTTIYEYDDLYRLATSTVDYLDAGMTDYTRGYAYDPIGNMIYNSATSTYAYANDNPHQLSAVGNVNLIYDNYGNQTYDGTYNYTWDWRERMATSYVAGTQAVTKYYYDHNNQRLLKYFKDKIWIGPDPGLGGIMDGGDIPEDDQDIPGDGDMPEGDSVGYWVTIEKWYKYIDKYYQVEPNDLTKTHIFLNNLHLATVNGTSTPYYLLGDHLGSSSILTDSSGQVTELSDYEPYGKIGYENTISDPLNEYKFTGKEYDEENELQYFGARYYDNRLGRFTAIDPLLLMLNKNDIYDKLYKDNYELDNGFKNLVQNELKDKRFMTEQDLKRLALQYFLSDPQHMNNYSYVVNNPIAYVDDTGEGELYIGVKGQASAGVSGSTTYRVGVVYGDGNITFYSATSEGVAIGNNAGGSGSFIVGGSNATNINQLESIDVTSEFSGGGACVTGGVQISQSRDGVIGNEYNLGLSTDVVLNVAQEHGVETTQVHEAVSTNDIKQAYTQVKNSVVNWFHRISNND